MAQRTDVAVVGAGLAGLSLAQRLRGVGATVEVLEARDRVGGRVCTETFGGAAFDVGGQWVGPSQTRVRALARELDVGLFPQHHQGAHVLDRGGRIRRHRRAIPPLPVLALARVELGIRRLDAMARRVPLDAPARTARAADWDGRTVAAEAARLLPHREARALFETAVRTVFGVEPAELSLLYFLFYLNAAGGFRALVDVEDGAQQDRVVGGAQRLADGLARALGDAVHLGAAVRRIVASNDGVRLEAEGRTVEARYAVMAIPPHLASRVRFEPALPPLRDQVLQRWGMGATVKVLVTYREASWRRAGLSGEAVCPEGPISCTFDATSHDGVPALVAFVVGRHARRWSRRPPAERRDLVVRELERLLGAGRSAVTAYREKDWSADPWSGGCPVATLPPGALSAHAAAWRAPCGRIHWAGTETARHWNGYMEGALESAERVASEVLSRL